ncbi:MAG: hypothetical protein DMG22_04170 [Acidobacteria bacterium]|nr:MAG: hypothetical protein DMG22_04170 [Acidobacteriota bacterium]
MAISSIRANPFEIIQPTRRPHLLILKNFRYFLSGSSAPFDSLQLLPVAVIPSASEESAFRRRTPL